MEKNALPVIALTSPFNQKLADRDIIYTGGYFILHAKYKFTVAY
jgi:hypothetical protein